MLELVKADNALLRKPATPLHFNGQDARYRCAVVEIVRDMWEALEREKGVGLAAPQVGVDLKIAVMAVGPRRWVLGNPRILRHKGPKIAIPEGCLSLPGVSYLVPRWMEIRGAYVDLRGVIRVETFKGLAAQAFQHELDHLNGVLIDKIGTRMN